MKTYVICTRDPDWANEYTVVEGDEPGVVIHDIDLGGDDLSHLDELFPWAAGHLDAAYGMPHEPKTIIGDIVWDVIDRYRYDLTDAQIAAGLAEARAYFTELRQKGLI